MEETDERSLHSGRHNGCLGSHFNKSKKKKKKTKTKKPGFTGDCRLRMIGSDSFFHYNMESSVLPWSKVELQGPHKLISILDSRAQAGLDL